MAVQVFQEYNMLLEIYAETYDVEVVDRISLSDSLFVAKSSIIFFL